jgi:hypothetical protein
LPFASTIISTSSSVKLNALCRQFRWDQLIVIDGYIGQLIT